MSKQHRKKVKKAYTEVMKSIKGGFVFLYAFLMMVVFVYYMPDKFWYIGSYKIQFYHRITVVFLIGALFLIIVSVIVKKKDIFKDLKPDYTDIAILFYAFCSLISFILSPYRDTALHGYDGWRMGVLTQLAMIAAYLIVSRWTDKWKELAVIAVIAIVPESVLVILQRFGLDPFHLFEGMNLMDWNRRNMLGTIGNSNWLCGYMICIVPIIIWLYLYEEKMVKTIIWGIVLFVSLSALMLQGSSSGIVALAGIWLFCLLFVVKTYKQLIRLITIPLMISFFWAVLSLGNVELLEPEEANTPQHIYSFLWIIPMILLAVLVLCLLFYQRKKKEDKLPARFSQITRIAVASIMEIAGIMFLIIQLARPYIGEAGIVSKFLVKDSWGSYRVLLWKETIKRFLSTSNLKTILFGFGPDCYGKWFVEQSIVIPIEGAMKGAVFTNAHNTTLTAMVNIGLIGLIAYSSVYVTLFIAFFKSAGKKPVGFLGLLLLIGVSINNIFSFQQICATPIFILLVGIVVCAVRSEKSEIQQK